MTTDGIERALGRLEGRLTGIDDKLESLEHKVDHIIVEGCTRGQQNMQDIDKLDKRVKSVEMTVIKMIGIALLGSGGGAGIIKLLDTLLG